MDKREKLADAKVYYVPFPRRGVLYPLRKAWEIIERGLLRMLGWVLKDRA